MSYWPTNFGRSVAVSSCRPGEAGGRAILRPLMYGVTCWSASTHNVAVRGRRPSGRWRRKNAVAAPEGARTHGCDAVGAGKGWRGDLNCTDSQKPESSQAQITSTITVERRRRGRFRRVLVVGPCSGAT